MTHILPKPTNIDTIKCGGKHAKPNAAGYSGCKGTGSYNGKERNCFRCRGVGWQTEIRYNANQAYDRKALV